jgi:hypothetical protein
MFACVLAAIFAAAPAAALATTQTASSGSVTATFSFTAGPNNTYPTKTLTISRSGQVVYNQPVASRLCGAGATAQTYCTPGFGAAGHSSVHVVDLEHNGEPNVILDLYTGGAHCCSIEQVFSFDSGTGSYVMSQHDFLDPGERIVDLGHNGRHEFLTADATFAYAFTDFANSGFPIQILAFASGHFTDVTRHYPKLIAQNAAMFLKAFKHNLGNGDGLIAAWAADEDSLGHSALVASTLAKYLKAGELHGANYASGKQFIKALNKLLKKDGYVH